MAWILEFGKTDIGIAFDFGGTRKGVAAPFFAVSIWYDSLQRAPGFCRALRSLGWVGEAPASTCFLGLTRAKDAGEGVRATRAFSLPKKWAGQECPTQMILAKS